MVVGLCELDGVREQALYVGLSRPSVFLSLFGSPKGLRKGSVSSPASKGLSR